jgi:hypothetical protein
MKEKYSLLALCLLSRTGPGLALPTGNATDPHIIAPLWVQSPATRGTANILYSCLLTISLCVYTTLHLNILARGTTPFRNLLKRWILAFSAPAGFTRVRIPSLKEEDRSPYHCRTRVLIRCFT